jgi:lipopolysaccharide/colanic/teichoic acid biosynthesis glycosyltransferase
MDMLAASGGQGFSAAMKFIGDRVIACLVLLLLAPIMALIALCVVLESRGGPFYRAARVGKHGCRIYVLKFRKMRRGAAGRPLTVADDERFTRLGRYLARTKLDELPQLINVIRGQMSLVGPRPEDPSFVERHSAEFEPILKVRPGMTGLSQLAFAAESRILDPTDPILDYEERILPQKLKLDALYVNQWHPLLDVRIACWTLAETLLSVPVSVDRSTARMGVRTASGGRRRAAPGWSAGPGVLGVERSALAVGEVDPAGNSASAAAASVASEVPAL